MSTKYTKEILEEAVSSSDSIAGVLRYLGLKQAGGTQAHISRRIKQLGIDTSHFVGQAHGRGKKAVNRKLAVDILIVLPVGSTRPKGALLRRAMFEMNIPHVCAICSQDTIWNHEELTLEVDHIDGNWLNNLIENLRFLCPNCHSQQITSKQKVFILGKSKLGGKQYLGKSKYPYPINN